MSQKSELIFVYGSLRSEFANIGKVLGPDRVQGTLYDLISFPGFAQSDEEDQWVVGEVVSVTPDILAQLDEYEGVSSGLYSRERITTENGKQVWVYECNPRVYESFPTIPSGDWLKK